MYYQYPGDEENYIVLYQYGIEYNGSRINFLNYHQYNMMSSENKLLEAGVKNEFIHKLDSSKRTGIIPDDIFNKTQGLAFKNIDSDVSVESSNKTIGGRTSSTYKNKKETAKKKPRKFSFL